MQEYQRKFIELALKKGVLKFGSFVLKSGRNIFPETPFLIG